MANHKSAEKRNRQSIVRRQRNRSNRTRMRNAIKTVDAAIEARRALERPCSSKPLLAMLEQDEEYSGLTKYWADSARVFRHVWYETT